jgi:hypothetical protein
MPAPSLVVQTTYAELLERCTTTAFDASFSEPGSFTSKEINGKRYWYFQARSKEGRTQRYVGPETAELLARIHQHRQVRDDERERRALVSTLVRSFGLPAPIGQIGDVLAALSREGVFRLRGVLVGTIAYQAYPAMLGERLPSALLQTSDIDVAQFRGVSVSVGDQTAPMLDVLKSADTSFREIPPTPSHAGVFSYRAKGGLRVDFLTPNEGPDSDSPQTLPALQTAAQPLRFLDYLIHDAVPAVVLHGPGVLVQVPAPERFAVHKVILAQRRPASATKSDKDSMQAAALLELLAARRPHELKLAWEEAYNRGPQWRQLLLTGLARLAPRARNLTLKAAGLCREIVPGIDLTFDNPVLRYDSTRDIVHFSGNALNGTVRCAVSREALEDHFGADNATTDGRLEAVRRNRSAIERLLRMKYLSRPVEEAESVLLKTSDFEDLPK